MKIDEGTVLLFLLGAARANAVFDGWSAEGALSAMCRLTKVDKDRLKENDLALVLTHDCERSEGARRG